MKTIKFISAKSWTLILVICFVSVVGCKKDLNKSLSVNSQAVNGIQPYPLAGPGGDWTTLDVMPTPSGYPTVYPPWANSAVRAFSTDIAYDMQPSDGWDLMYNVFTTTQQLPSNPYFILYNKYRGLLRIYLYCSVNGFVPTTYLTSGIIISPNSGSNPTNMLNFAGQDVVDVNAIPKSTLSQIEPFQMATGSWYACQYEIAYDPTISTSTYGQVGMNWSLGYTNITSVNLGGTAVGTLNGTIATQPPSGAFNWLGNSVTGALSGLGLSVISNNMGAGYNTTTGAGNGLGLPGLVFKAAADGLTGSLTGVIKNVFNLISGGSSANSQLVNLTLNANINLSGNQTSNGALIPSPGLAIGIPGTINSQLASGTVPGKLYTMGVFNLSARPTVHVAYQKLSPMPSAPWDWPLSYYYKNTFTIDPSVYGLLQVNPNLAGLATVSISKAEVLLENAIYTDEFFNITPHTEIVGGLTVANVTPPYNTCDGIQWGGAASNGDGQGPAVVRLTVKVTSTNNSFPTVTIVKTFVANVVTP